MDDNIDILSIKIEIIGTVSALIINRDVKNIAKLVFGFSAPSN